MKKCECGNAIDADSIDTLCPDCRAKDDELFVENVDKAFDILDRMGYDTNKF